MDHMASARQEKDALLFRDVPNDVDHTKLHIWDIIYSGGTSDQFLDIRFPVFPILPSGKKLNGMERR